jgi:hypothetical protein
MKHEYRINGATGGMGRTCLYRIWFAVAMKMAKPRRPTVVPSAFPSVLPSFIITTQFPPG